MSQLMTAGDCRELQVADIIIIIIIIIIITIIDIIPERCTVRRRAVAGRR